MLSDTAVYQCEATNKHGTIILNTLLHVVSKCVFARVCLRICVSLTTLLCVCLRVRQVFLLRSSPPTASFTESSREKLPRWNVSRLGRHGHTSIG